MGVTIHERHPVTMLARWHLQYNKTNLADCLDFLEAPAEWGVALWDIPTGVYTWELMNAFPNSTVILTVRNVRMCEGCTEPSG